MLKVKVFKMIDLIPIKLTLILIISLMAQLLLLILTDKLIMKTIPKIKPMIQLNLNFPTDHYTG